MFVSMSIPFSQANDKKMACSLCKKSSLTQMSFLGSRDHSITDPKDNNGCGDVHDGGGGSVGPGVSCCKVGDIVAYAGFLVYARAEEEILPAERVILVPCSVDP
ncbi:hypothetical protein Tco_0552981 [Tanacetum coccineum]